MKNKDPDQSHQNAQHGLLVRHSKSKVQVFDTPQVVNCFKVEFDAALLPGWFNW